MTTRRSHPQTPASILGALAFVVFFAWTFVGSFAAASFVCITNGNGSLAAVMQRLNAQAANCHCATCPSRRGGKCCCPINDSPVGAMAFRAVCEETPQAALTGSPMPPTILPNRILAAAAPCPSNQPFLYLSRHRRGDTNAVSATPDIPPRSLS